MTKQDDIALMAHLMRRAGFGASRDELEARVAKGYAATVEELLHPETQPPVDPYVLLRHQPASLLPGGRFAGHLLGDRDEWSGTGSFNYHNRMQVDLLLEGLQIDFLREDELDLELTSGQLKHWHIFHVVAARN